jgi:hypothetical protein
VRRGTGLSLCMLIMHSASVLVLDRLGRRGGAARRRDGIRYCGVWFLDASARSSACRALPRWCSLCILLLCKFGSRAALFYCSCCAPFSPVLPSRDRARRRGSLGSDSSRQHFPGCPDSRQQFGKYGAAQHRVRSLSNRRAAASSALSPATGSYSLLHNTIKFT